MSAVAVADLHKSYGSFEAVKGIDFEIRTGEVFGLLGPNGAGKTTTVEILEGYRKRDRGGAPGGARGEGRRTRQDALRRPEAPPRPGGRARRRPGAALPGRADDGLRPRRPARGLGDDPVAPRARQDDPPDHALHRGGAATRRPRGR